MARPLEYNYTEFLDETTSLFLVHGYEHISINDIIQETGLNKHSLYKLFGGKDDIYRAVVKNYRDRFLCTGYELLEEGEGLTSIETFFNILLSGKGNVRCLMVDTLSNLIEDDVLKKLAKAHFKRVERAYAKNLEIAKEKKEVNAELDSKMVAKFLVMLQQGLPANTEAFGKKKALAYVNSYLGSLR